LLTAQRPLILAKPEYEIDLIKLKALVEGAGYKVKVSGNQLEIDAPIDWAPNLNRLAFESGITLSSISPLLPSLEETFF